MLPRRASAGRSDGPTAWEQAIAVGVIMLLTGAVIGPVFAPTQEETPVLRLVWLPVYAATLGLVLYRADRLWRAWPAFLALGLTLLLTFASKWWSLDPETTQRRVIALAMTGVFAVYLGAVFRGAALPRLLMLCGLIFGIGSLVAVFAFPTIGVHQDVNAGLWRGLWYEKNQMGAVMVVFATAAAACLASGDPRRTAPAVAVVLCSVLVLATQSKTSLLCLLLGLGVVGGFWALRRGGLAFSVFAVWAGVVLAGFGVWLWETHSVDILEAFGKDPSLTGRTDIWASLMRRVAERPWTGYGYAAFWGPLDESPPADWVRRETGWTVPSAHNGWIDLLVQLGWPGAVLVGGLIAATFAAAAARAARAGEVEGWWSPAFLTAFVALSLSESILLSHQNLPWTLFLAVLTRAVLPAPTPRAALARPARGPYVAPSRIAAQSAHARQAPLRPRRALPVR